MDTRDYHHINSSIKNRYFRIQTLGDSVWIVPQRDWLEDEDAEAHPELAHLAGPFPARPTPWEVCPTCRGDGKHVSPNIDRYGISQQDFDDDPDFADSYFGGAYDVTCSQCDGRRVVRDVEPTTDDGRAFMDRVQELIEDHWEYERECAAERRYMYGPEYKW